MFGTGWSAMDTSHIFNGFDQVLNSRDNDRAVVMALLMYLYFGTLLTRQLLPLISARVPLLSVARQQQLAVTVPMLFLRCGVAALVAESEFSYRYHSPSTPKPISLLDYQANLSYLLTTGYVFELLFRPSPLDLVLHHLAVVAAQFYYFYHRVISPEEDHLAVFQLLIILVIYGIGPVDFASENIRLIYYAAKPSFLTLGVIYALTTLGWAARFVQWWTMAGYIVEKNEQLRDIWNLGEAGLWASFLAFWIYCEVVEVVHFLRLADKWKARIWKSRA